MSNITLSVLGLYNYDDTLFDPMVVPGGVDKTNVLIPNLLSELAELEVLYSDPEIMKTIIEVWSKKQLPVWTKLMDTVNLEYNPIYNKDGYYEEDETTDRDTTNSVTDILSATVTDEGSNTNLVSAFNSSAFENREKDELENERREEQQNSSNSSGNENGTVHRERHEYGNIGVTTTQQMIKEERDVAQFNIVNYIIEDFKQRFCVLVY